MISYDEARRRVEHHRPAIRGVAVSRQEALGRVTVGEVVAKDPSPRFDNSAVDGFAVGSYKGPWTVIGTVAAGSAWEGLLGTRDAVQILTGAPIPDGTVAVFMQEDATVDGNCLSVADDANGSHIRRRGEEYSAGSLIVPDGTVISPTVLGALAALGLESVHVRGVPRVGILVTGSELCVAGKPLREGQIYESNSAALTGWLRMLGAEVEVVHSQDDSATVESLIRGLANNCDLVLSTGGVCYGAFDFVRQGVAAVGYETVFEGVAIKPGKPVAFGVRADGKAWFGLPGNPMSSFTTFALFVTTWLGRGLRFQPMTLGHAFTTRPGREEFVPATVRWQPDPSLWLAPAIGSHATAALVSSNGIARLPLGVETLREGDTVSFAWLPWGLQS